MKDHFLTGFLSGLFLPFILIAIFYVIRFNYMSVSEFVRQAFMLKVHLKIIAVGVFFSSTALFFLFIRIKKNKAAKGIITAIFVYFFIMLFSSVA